MSLFENAIDSIIIGIEDFKSADDRRALSAVRNVHAGILLLCKEKLRQLSPDDEILLAQRLELKPGPDGRVIVVKSGPRTIDRAEVEKRFKTFGIHFNWKRFDIIAKIRNDIEHAFLRGRHKSAQEAVANAFILIRHLLTDILGLDPAWTLGPQCWDILLQNEEVFEAELAACRNTLKSLRWTSNEVIRALEHFQCPKCGSYLLKQKDSSNVEPQDAAFFCLACGDEPVLGNVLSVALNETLGVESHVVIKDGGESLLETCPVCGEETFIVEENVCPNCDFELPENSQCAICNQHLNAEEYAEFNGLCSYHAYQAGKDD
jgi:ssDNA-binding Zn-finger/Zn-ribbon topoisomerase 1